MKKVIYSLLFFLFAFSNLYSQHTSIKVNGLELGKIYTDSQIRDSLGIPTAVRYPSEDDEVLDLTTYFYNSNEFFFQNGMLTDFVISSNQFKLNNFLTIGMDFSSATKLGGVISSSTIPGVYYWYPNEINRSEKGYAKITVNTSDNSISSIVVESPILML